jgi:hypothetical protein
MLEKKLKNQFLLLLLGEGLGLFSIVVILASNSAT